MSVSSVLLRNEDFFRRELTWSRGCSSGAFRRATVFTQTESAICASENPVSEASCKDPSPLQWKVKTKAVGLLTLPDRKNVIHLRWKQDSPSWRFAGDRDRVVDVGWRRRKKRRLRIFVGGLCGGLRLALGCIHAGSAVGDERRRSIYPGNS